MDKEMLHQELNMIQDCIKRMAFNSFMLKGWYVSLVFLGANIINGKILDYLLVSMLLLILTLVFWCLDAFFLKMETLYRWKYEWVIKDRLKGNVADFYDLNPYNYNEWINPCDKMSKIHFTNYVFSKTLIPLYGFGIVVPISYILFALIKRLCF